MLSGQLAPEIPPDFTNSDDALTCIGPDNRQPGGASPPCCCREGAIVGWRQPSATSRTGVERSLTDAVSGRRARTARPATRRTARGDELNRLTVALERQEHVLHAVFAFSERMAGLTNPSGVPDALAVAIREATGASYALVGRWIDDGARLALIAQDGLSRDQLRLLSALDLRPDRFRMVRGGLAGHANVRVPPFDPDDVPVDVVEALGVVALGGAAILVDDRPWGVVIAAATAADPPLVDDGARLLVGLASVAATAIGRAEGRVALERQAEILESSVSERTLQLRQAIAELRHASHAKTELLANVSHELRTPLTAILGYSDLLLHGIDGQLTAEQREDVETIDRSGRHLLRLIDDLLDITRIESGRVVLRREVVDLHGIILSAVDDLRPLAGQKGLSIEVQSVTVPDQFTGDEARLRAILLNLLGNAVKFTQPGGRIGVAATIDDAETVRIEVTDTGIGIAPDEQALVFDKFHRAASPEHVGNGLGLSIAREFARLHGGDIVLESTLGLGSRFTVLLPAQPVHSDSRAATAGATGDDSGG